MKINFRPSDSKYEHLPREYYTAEQHGLAGRYDTICSKNCSIRIFDKFSLWCSWVNNDSIEAGC